MTETREALWWDVDASGRVVCHLCPRECVLREGQHGFCYIRKNEAGRLVNLGYGRPIALNIDPIEKKPLNHFLPGTPILSLGTAGCNMGCRFCQNWDLAKAREDHGHTRQVDAEAAVTMARSRNCPSIAFTYNEPSIWGEYVIDVAREAHARGLRTVMVSNGYLQARPLRDIYAHIDAANIDLKAFSEEFYRGMTLSHLQPVLDTLVRLKKETATWIEITTLVIPGRNDAPDETHRMCQWIVENLGPDVPLHLTAFHPDYHFAEAPRTPEATLRRAREIAMEAGLHYVYTGNVHDPQAQTTFCPQCATALIERDWHSVRANRLRNGRCRQCQANIAGVF